MLVRTLSRSPMMLLERRKVLPVDVCAVVLLVSRGSSVS